MPFASPESRVVSRAAEERSSDCTPCCRSVRLELDRLRALGVEAVTVAIPFPELYAPFLTFNGDPDDLQPFVAFFAGVVDEAHARGMKVAVESGPYFSAISSQDAGLDAASYYRTLSWNAYVIGRATQIVTIVRDIRPDVLSVGSEPDTEHRLTGQINLRSVAGFAGMVRYDLDALASAGLTGVPIVAGTGTWMSDNDSFAEALAEIPGLWGIDLHLYPVNLDYLDRALSLAEIAHARGKRVTMLECWLQKERDSELGTIDPAFDPTLYARDTFSFWAPLDRRFLAVVAKIAQVAKMDYLSPFWSRYFFAYLDYDQVGSLSADQIVSLATQAHAQALVSGAYTDTGRVYTTLIDPHVLRRRLQRR